MPLSSTYQMLKLKLGPQDKSGTLRRKTKRKKKKIKKEEKRKKLT